MARNMATCGRAAPARREGARGPECRPAMWKGQRSHPETAGVCPTVGPPICGVCPGGHPRVGAGQIEPSREEPVSHRDPCSPRSRSPSGAARLGHEGAGQREGQLMAEHGRNGSPGAALRAAGCHAVVRHRGVRRWGRDTDQLAKRVHGHAADLGLGVSGVAGPRRCKPIEELGWVGRKGADGRNRGGREGEPGADGADIAVPGRPSFGRVKRSEGFGGQALSTKEGAGHLTEKGLCRRGGHLVQPGFPSPALQQSSTLRLPVTEVTQGERWQLRRACRRSGGRK